jgi:hypothetical protein
MAEAFSSRGFGWMLEVESDDDDDDDDDGATVADNAAASHDDGAANVSGESTTRRPTRSRPSLLCVVTKDG